MKECPEFNTIDAFRFYDVEAQGFLDSYLLLKAFKKFGINLDGEDVVVILSKFDKD